MAGLPRAQLSRAKPIVCLRGYGKGKGEAQDFSCMIWVTVEAWEDVGRWEQHAC